MAFFLTLRQSSCQPRAHDPGRSATTVVAWSHVHPETQGEESLRLLNQCTCGPPKADASRRSCRCRSRSRRLFFARPLCSPCASSGSSLVAYLLVMERLSGLLTRVGCGFRRAYLKVMRRDVCRHKQDAGLVQEEKCGWKEESSSFGL